MTAIRSIHDLPVAQAELARRGTTVDRLGCVMLPIQGFNVFEGRGELIGTTDLYTSSNLERFWIKGDIIGHGAHATLLYGLLTPAYEQPDAIAAVMDGWEWPDALPVERFEVFPSPYDDEPYGCVVARLAPIPELLDAHARLSCLPHVDTYPDYKPHATIAYVKEHRARDWADILNLDSVILTTDEAAVDLDLGSNRG
jgi:hypothetical protein